MSTIVNIGGQSIDLSTLDPAVLAALTNASKTVVQDRTEQVKSDLTEFVADAVEYVVVNNLVVESQSSATVGAYVRGIRVEHDDRVYTVSLSVTDQAATVAREPQFPKKSRSTTPAKA